MAKREQRPRGARAGTGGSRSKTGRRATARRHKASSASRDGERADTRSERPESPAGGLPALLEHLAGDAALLDELAAAVCAEPPPSSASEHLALAHWYTADPTFAWAALEQLSDGEPLPAWVLAYLRQRAGAVREAQDGRAIASALGFPTPSRGERSHGRSREDFARAVELAAAVSSARDRLPGRSDKALLAAVAFEHRVDEKTVRRAERDVATSPWFQRERDLALRSALVRMVEVIRERVYPGCDLATLEWLALNLLERLPRP